MLPRTAALGDMFRGDSVRISENLAFDQAIVRTQASTHAAPLQPSPEMTVLVIMSLLMIIHDHVNVVHDMS